MSTPIANLYNPSASTGYQNYASNSTSNYGVVPVSGAYQTQGQTYSTGRRYDPTLAYQNGATGPTFIGEEPPLAFGTEKPFNTFMDQSGNQIRPSDLIQASQGRRPARVSSTQTKVYQAAQALGPNGYDYSNDGFDQNYGMDQSSYDDQSQGYGGDFGSFDPFAASNLPAPISQSQALNNPFLPQSQSQQYAYGQGQNHTQRRNYNWQDNGTYGQSTGTRRQSGGYNRQSTGSRRQSSMMNGQMSGTRRPSGGYNNYAYGTQNNSGYGQTRRQSGYGQSRRQSGQRNSTTGYGMSNMRQGMDWPSTSDYQQGSMMTRQSGMNLPMSSNYQQGF